MSKPNVARVLSATAWTASVHTSYMSKPNVARVLSATAWTASVHTLHIGTWTFEGTGSRPSKLEGTFEGALRRYLPRVATFQATFEGSGPLKVPLKVPFEGTTYLRWVGTFEGTFEGPSSKVYNYEGRSPSTFSASPLKSGTSVLPIGRDN